MVLAAVCLLASNVAAVCDNNSIKYSGQYTVTWSGRSTVNDENDAVVTVHETAQFVITTPPGEQAPSERYWMGKFTGNETYEDATLSAAVTAAEENAVDALCVAAPYDNAGLQCADIDDVGILTLHPLEVDAECNLVKAWGTYLEPATPGCDSPQCRPVASVRTLVRVGSEGTATISVANGAVSRGSLMLSAVAGLIALGGWWW